MNGDRAVTKMFPVIAEEVTTSCLGLNMIIRYNKTFPFGIVGEYHVTLIEVALIGIRMSGLTPSGAIIKINAYMYM